MLGLAALSLLYLASLEMGRWRDQAIQIDELYFSACAARGLAVGQFPVAGCHDNKGPLILLVHQWVQMASSAYDLVAIKTAAYTLVLLVAGAVALLAHRLAGPLAGASAAALAVQALATNASHLALKTETLGVFFLLVSLAVALGPPGRHGRWRLFASGVLLGMAVVTKQTFAFVAVAYVAWFWWSSSPGRAGRLRAAVTSTLVFCIGVLVPFGVFLFGFLLDHRESEFLSSFFVYPSVYGTVAVEPLYKRWVWGIGSVLTAMGSTLLLSTLFVGAAARTLLASVSQSDDARVTAQPRMLVLLVILVMLLGLLLAPVFYAYHIVPVRVMMAVLGGVLISELAIAFEDQLPLARACLFWGLVIPSLFLAVAVWSLNGGGERTRENGSGGAAAQTGGLPDATPGEFAYVLGMWPGFYVYNGLIPASNVMYPWALTGAPPSNFYTPPPPGSLRSRGLAWAQEQASAALLADFRRTPPRYIMVVRAMARKPDSDRVADAPGFDEYLRDTCIHIREISASDPRRDGGLYQCHGRPDGSVRPAPAK